MIQKGKLFIIATPIGNLGDITLRALETLKSVDAVLCEDTRHSLKLLNHYGIKKTLISFHEHNEKMRLAEIKKRLDKGENLALISDAGTPLISDPGFKLIQHLREEGFLFEGLPGPCAAINALILSALPTDAFTFLGFLPPRSAARIKKFKEVRERKETLIFYESTHRIEKFLKEAGEIFGDRTAFAIREMTKKFEEFISGPAKDLGKTIKPRSWKGEWVVLIEGKRD
ncbi:MAG: 16S rRNA (cytidine(1402)-2'-O)-methyltransferase [Deltaproteobacteria bacterium]|nr:16S rRNA (cytidine(1402)-2'-O)-methyltransferase [Deltaproteobacteria bacterium]